MKQYSRFFLVILCSTFVFQGCDKISSILNPNWLVGTWVLDREKTVEYFSTHNQRETPAGGLAGELAAAAILKSVDAMIGSLENVKFVFTETECSEGGSMKTYEIVSREANSMKIVHSDNVVRVYHREGDNIWYYLTGKEKFRIYLKTFGQ